MKDLMNAIALLWIFVFAGIKVVSQQPRVPVFKPVPASETQVNFANMLKETPNLNIITYEYYYNGGGVGLADFNNDGLTDIFLTANMQNSRLYLNKGNFRFEDVSAKAGIQGKKGWHTGVSIADVNGDGHLDIYVCYSGPVEAGQRTNELFINNGNLTFSEKAREMGVADPGYSTQAVFFDYDRDNDLDLFVINHNNKNLRNFDASIMKKIIDADAGDRLYRNDNNKFTDVTVASGIISNPLGYGLGVAVSDVDNDGWPDVYVTNDYVEEDYLYINNRDGTFTEKLKEQAGHLSSFSMGCDIADVNNDGWADIFTLDMLPADNRRQKLLYMPDNYELYNNTVQNGFYHQLMRNMLQLNNGNGTFSEVGQFSGIFCTDWSWSSLFVDLNNDGNKDLFVTNGYGRDMTNRDFVKFYANERLKYLRGEPSNNMFRMLQTIPVTPLRDYVFVNKGDLTFDDVSGEAGFTTENLSNGAAYADLDNDGDMDLVINHLNAPAGIYRNMLVENGSHDPWISFQLKGTGKNVFGLGARLEVYSPGQIIRLENTSVHGFQSAMHVPLHTGVPAGGVDSVVVCWPDGKRQRVKDVQMNRLNLITYQPDGQISSGQIFETVFKPDANKISYTHADDQSNDYKVQPLMPNMISHNGPKVARGDVNKDGLEDLYFCGSRDQTGKLLLQKEDGSFVEDNQPAFLEDAASEDADALFFDADRDGDLDLYVVSGGFNYNEGAAELQDRMYFNANGKFRKFAEVLPSETLSGSCVAAGDVDNDGDVDLFVGSRVTPGRYPEAPPSLLLLNNGRAEFSLGADTASLSLGMVTAAQIIDLDNDGKNELVVAGEWNHIHVLSAEDGSVKDVSSQYFDKAFKGWWNTLHFADMDKDGDMDLIAGNWGLNSAVKVTDTSEAVIYYGDFDNNGSIDPIICYHIQGKSYPMASRDEITDQMVSLRQKFPTYESYSNSTIEDVLTPEQLLSAKKLTVNHFNTTYFENNNGKLTRRNLPKEAEFFPVHSIATDDFDKDGNMDIVLAGNSDHARIKIGRIDAGYGLLLKGDGKGKFTSVSQNHSGLNVKGCTRDMHIVNSKNKHRLLFSVNQQPASVYSY
jgi:enediyne biosynthesis protein E4